MIVSPLPSHEVRRLLAAAGGDMVRFKQLEQARLAGEPLQYLEGTAVFGPLELVVDRRVLIPRPETEQLWVLSRSLVSRPAVVVDVCTGSGALALGCKRSWPDARVLATDLSAAAGDVARLNADRLGIDIEVLVGDLFDPLPVDLAGRVDLIVSNPPYVTEAEWETLPTDVRREPRMALVSGTSGLEILERLAAAAPRWLAPGGWIACEIGETQGAEVEDGFAAVLSDVAIRPDLTGRDRFVVARSRTLGSVRR
jgi:release factor glutamine methyltransferase